MSLPKCCAGCKLCKHTIHKKKKKVHLIAQRSNYTAYEDFVR